MSSSSAVRTAVCDLIQEFLLLNGYSETLDKFTIESQDVDKQNSQAPGGIIKAFEAGNRNKFF